MADLTIKQNDKGYTINFTWLKADGAAKDLSGCSVHFKAWQKGYPAVLLADIACMVTNAAGGLANCVVPAATFTKAELLDFELEALSTGQIDWSETYTLAVQESG
jgi:hypothetical protein